MQGHSTKIRLIAAIGAAAVAALGVSSSSFAKAAMIPELGDEEIAAAAEPKPKPTCQGELVSLGVHGADRYGLELFTWNVCGRRGAILFG